MAMVRPFRGLRYADSAGRPEDLVAPPYDVLSEEQRAEYAAKSPFNIVHLTLPEQLSDDRSKFVKYARSAARLEEWRRDGIVALEAGPAFYRYSQTFTVPGGGQHVRTSLVVSLKVEPYENGVVLPHEQTFPKHKEDRLRILEATRSHLECIFGLYEDDDNRLHSMVAQAPARKVVDMTTGEDGIRQTFEVIGDPEALEQLTKSFADRRLWIADGHHRYETALAFRQALGERPGLVAEDFMMMALDSMTDPGLVLLPTHRILKKLPVGADDLRERMAEWFVIEECPNLGLMQELSRRAGAGDAAFGVALPGGNGFVARAKEPRAIVAAMQGDGSDQLKSLDVSVLHAFVFERLLGLTGNDFFGYTRSEEEAVAAVENGSAASFLMNPPTVEDMRLIALGGEKMPQKSTYYYPKLLSGLVVWSLKDF